MTYYIAIIGLICVARIQLKDESEYNWNNSKLR